MTINIFQVPHGSNVNVGCGCGPGGSGSGQLPPGGPTDGLPPGGTAGGLEYDGAARVIDICANVQTIFQDSIADWINAVQNQGYIPSGAESILPTDVTNFVLDAIDELEGELYGPEYTLALRRWIVQRFTDPFPGFGASWYGVANFALKRTQLINTMPEFPYIVAGAPFGPALRAWALTADIEALNKRIRDSAGTASYTGECAQLQREAGREPYQPPSVSGGVIVLEDATYKYTRITSDTSALNGGGTINFSGSEFVGVIIPLDVRATPETGTGTAATFSTTITTDDVPFGVSGSTGTGALPADTFLATGLANIGQIAFNGFPSYFARFDGQTNPTNPTGEVHPVAGPFTGSITYNNDQNTTTAYEVWLVTALNGTAELA